MLLALQIAAAALTLAGLAYWTLTLLAARSFLRRSRAPAPPEAPVVLVLKPLRGLEPGLEECLRSHLDQDYPSYSVVFGFSDEEDPALDLVDALLREAPGRAHMIVTEARGPNRKIGTLLGMVGMLPQAQEAGSAATPSILVINDSDIRVPPGYLSQVVAAFGSLPAERPTGLVTCLYRGRPAPTLGSRLEALGIATDFIPGVLTARLLEGGLGFALGSTMALRPEVLQKIGGLEVLLEYLADDYELGRRVHQAGYSVALADVVVETTVPPCGLRDYLRHQLRWTRAIRASRPAGYAGLLLTFVLPWSLRTVAAAGAAPWSLALAAAAFALRFASAGWIAGRVLGDRHTLRSLWLLPLRDLIAPLLWFGAYTGSTVLWRGDRFHLGRGQDRGKLIPVHPSPDDELRTEN